MYTLVHPTLEEEQLTLEELVKRSPYTLLYFYPKNDTPGCTLEAQDFSTHIEEFSKLHIQIIGVSKDTHSSHCSFIKKYTLQASYLSDPDLILHRQFGARGEKNNYGKKVQGVIRSTALLDQQGKLLHARNNVRATGHVEKVLKEISSYLPTT